MDSSAYTELVLERIGEEVKESGYHAVIIDETSDISFHPTLAAKVRAWQGEWRTVLPEYLCPLSRTLVEFCCAGQPCTKQDNEKWTWCSARSLYFIEATPNFR